VNITENNLGIPPELYAKGHDTVLKAIEYVNNRFTTRSDRPIDFYAYWIGNNLSYKHTVVVESFLATQDLSKCRFYIYTTEFIQPDNIMYKYLDNKTVINVRFDLRQELRKANIGCPFYLYPLENHSLNPALESDFVRLLLLHNYGGVYIDFDVILLKDFAPLVDHEFVYQWGSYPNENMLNGAIMSLHERSKLAKALLRDVFNTHPIMGSLCWANDAYLRVKQQLPLLVFPGAIFNPEWQVATEMLYPLTVHDRSTRLYEGSYAWHWHNRWNEEIMPGSKFDILDKQIKERLKNK